MQKKNTWSSYRTTNLLIGFTFAILFCLMAFNYTSFSEHTNYKLNTIEIEDESVEIRRTVHPPKEKKIIPKPDKIETVDELVSSEDAIVQESELIPTEIDIPKNAAIDSTWIDNVNANKTSLPPIAPPINELSQTEVEDIPIRFPQQMAYYGNCHEKDISHTEKKACSDAAFMSYLYQHIHYPVIARQNNIQGTVIIEIIIGKKGNLESAKLVRDIGAGCGKEALRVVNSMGQWTPAKQNGRAVKLIMTLPIKFTLE